VAPPRHPYDTARVIYRVCGIDGFVAWAGNHYYVAARNMWWVSGKKTEMERQAWEYAT
jgi:hypothetical protein